uniref:(northern house mosquito) hypothetical protein n=1 Tax=Culex pipiens TaxID=7175 RepID=A0A8D8K6G2_CULPI
MLTPPATTSGFFSSGDVTLGDPSSSEATAIRRSFCRIERSKRRRNRIWFPMARRRPILLCGRPVLLLLLSSTVTLGRIWLDTSSPVSSPESHSCVSFVKVTNALLDLCAYSRVDVNDSVDDELLATGCRYSGLLLGLFRVGVVVLE